MNHAFSDRKIKSTKKEHRCCGCNQIIPIGSPTIYISSIYDGNFNSGHMCRICEAFSKSFHNLLHEDGEGWEFYSFTEYDQYKPFKLGYEQGLRSIQEGG